MAGIVGLVFLIFGLISKFILNIDLYYFSSINLLLGFLCIGFYLISGGVKNLNNLKIEIYDFIYILSFLAFIIFLNLLVVKKDPLYFDSTSLKVFSLAPQTENVIKNLKQKIIIRGFFVDSKIEPKLEKLLERFKSEKLELVTIDPTKAPQLVKKYGVSEKNTLHFSIEGKDKEVKLVRNIDEQSIVNSILKLTRLQEHQVLILGEKLEDDSETGFLFLKEAILGENINLRTASLLTEIPAGLSALVILPISRDFLPEEISNIENFMNKGGSILILTESQKNAQNLNSLLSKQGITVGKNVIIEEQIKQGKIGNLVLQPLVKDYGEHAITAGFNKEIILSTANTVNTNNTKKVYELGFTSPLSWADSDLESIFSDKPQAAFNEDGDIKGPLSIAVAKESESNNRLVVIGDSDFVNNINIRSLFNRDFFLNSLNWVIGQKQGISIRAATISGSKKLIPEKSLKIMYLLTGLILPEIILLLGFISYRKE